jgi:hypothetical protein
MTKDAQLLMIMETAPENIVSDELWRMQCFNRTAIVIVTMNPPRR